MRNSTIGGLAATTVIAPMMSGTTQNGTRYLRLKSLKL